MAVPIGSIPELLEAIEAVAGRTGLVIGTFGHAGDGNMHPTIVSDPHDDSSREQAKPAFREIVRKAVELGGTITGEHGVGLLKRAFQHDEMGDAALLLHAKVKRAVDPLDILNPGKVLLPV